MAKITQRAPPDRSKIDVSDLDQLKWWTKVLSVSKEDLLWAIDKVGNAAAAVRKELQLNAGSRPLKPDDFPVNVDGTVVKAHDGKAIAEATDPAVAEDIADRLNDDEACREEDKWSA